MEIINTDHSVGILSSNRQGRILSCNDSTEKLFGYNKGELLGEFIEVLVPIDKRVRHQKLREIYYKNPGPRDINASLNIFGLTKQGKQIPIQLCLSSNIHEGEIYVTAFIFDRSEDQEVDKLISRLCKEADFKASTKNKTLKSTITILKQSRINLKCKIKENRKQEKTTQRYLEKERSLSELKTRLISLASHELRTPLSGILTSTCLIEEYYKTRDNEKIDFHLNRVKTSVRYLTELIEDFLCIERIEQKKLVCRPTSFDVVALTDEIVGDFSLNLSKEQNLSFQPPQAKIMLFQDKEFVRNSLRNLISNAVKYSNKKDIVVTQSIIGDLIKISIIDQGIGIPESQKGEIFNRFYRATNSKEVQGTGLGLNIVKKYLEALEGNINFSSKEGHGSQFTITIPCNYSQVPQRGTDKT